MMKAMRRLISAAASLPTTCRAWWAGANVGSAYSIAWIRAMLARAQAEVKRG